MNEEHKNDVDSPSIRSITAVLFVSAALVCFLVRLRFNDKDKEFSISPVIRAGVADHPYCSFNAFRSILQRSSDGHLPGTGTWQRTANNRVGRFYPSICRLKHGMEIPSSALISCLRRKTLRHIVIIGDSNGRRYFYALLWHLSHLNGVRCTTTTNQNAVNWISYDGPNVYLVRRCRCEQPRDAAGRCTNLYNRTRPEFRHVRCHFPGDRSFPNFSVVIEFTHVLRALNTNVRYTTDTSGCDAGSRSPVIRTETKPLAEFLFAEFYAHHRPDLVVFFDNAHDKMLLGELEKGMNQVSMLIERFVRPPTKLVWVSRIAEDVRRKPKRWRGMKYENGTMTRNRWLAAANRIAFSKMGKLFVHAGQPMLFPDLFDISKPVLNQYNIDGVHMKPVWYQHIVSYILQTFCSDP